MVLSGINSRIVSRRMPMAEHVISTHKTIAGDGGRRRVWCDVFGRALYFVVAAFLTNARIHYNRHSG